jgi:hypothetical protein
LGEFSARWGAANAMTMMITDGIMISKLQRDFFTMLRRA